eukprot:TRINITY_DN3067_c0_g1_i1.p2 TRINITY_DN3067_c0_g1~~TRINITY_DN3067_c0_g1_i1.p2  ORF type:complete len:169 (-),score=18.67 TRINITY_DN3067_c0_g1_i1:58-564(-)
MQQSVAICLNSYFSLRTYDGGAQSEEYEVLNILHTDSRKFHCSAKSGQLNLVLECKEPLTITMISFSGAGGGCTCPLANGFVAPLLEPPTADLIEKLTLLKESFPPATYFSLPKPEAAADFTTVDVSFPDETKCKYLYIKFADSWEMEEGGSVNIDVGQVLIYGFPPA